MEELAGDIADKIEYEEGVIASATFEAKHYNTPQNRKRTRYRDIKRSQSKIIAFREVLQLILDELKPEQTPDVDSFMEKRPSTL